MFLCVGYEDESKTAVVTGTWQDTEAVRPQPLVGGSRGRIEREQEDFAGGEKNLFRRRYDILYARLCESYAGVLFVTYANKFFLVMDLTYEFTAITSDLSGGIPGRR